MTVHTEVRTDREAVMQRIARMIRKDPSWNYTVEQLQRYGKYNSKFHFGVVFKHVIGTTPIEYAITQRVIYAKWLLRVTTMSISDIAQQAGFVHHPAFTQTFKRRVGLTPATYRLRIQEGLRLEPKVEGPVEPCGGIVRHS